MSRRVIRSLRPGVWAVFISKECRVINNQSTQIAVFCFILKGNCRHAGFSSVSCAALCSVFENAAVTVLGLFFDFLFFFPSPIFYESVLMGQIVLCAFLPIIFFCFFRCRGQDLDFFEIKKNVLAMTPCLEFTCNRESLHCFYFLPS